MPSYLSPGVYVEEVSSGIKPIEGVGTSVGAFIGYAEKGEINKPTLITSWEQYKRVFGGVLKDHYLSLGVYGFFAEGGTSCFVIRAADPAAGKTAIAKGKFVTTGAGGKDILEVSALGSAGSWGNRVSVTVTKAKSKPDAADKYDVKVFYKSGDLTKEGLGILVESFADVPTVGADKVALESSYISIKQLATGLPTIGAAGTTITLAGGLDGIPTGAAKLNRLTTSTSLFDNVDNINLLAIPDLQGDVDQSKQCMAYCEGRGDVFFIGDSLKNRTSTQDLLKDRESYNSSYAAMYWPWVEILHPETGLRELVPPSCHMAGRYASTDQTRGVHKAPAGTVDGFLRTVVGLEYVATKGEQDQLNGRGINVIRSFPDSGIVVWGARTVSNDSEWKYINIRRLFLMVEESIDEASQWVVFEPNDPKLWGSVKRNLTGFLNRVWRDGALVGNTAEQAFFVKVDAENNPPEVMEAGQLIIEVGIAPVRPAEFVIIRISQKTLELS